MESYANKILNGGDTENGMEGREKESGHEEGTNNGTHAKVTTVSKVTLERALTRHVVRTYLHQNVFFLNSTVIYTKLQ